MRVLLWFTGTDVNHLDLLPDTLGQKVPARECIVIVHPDPLGFAMFGNGCLQFPNDPDTGNR